MKLTPPRQRFLQALLEHGPFSRLPDGVQFPSDVALGQLERAGYLLVRPVGPPVAREERSQVVRRVEFAITARGRIALEQLTAAAPGGVHVQ